MDINHGEPHVSPDKAAFTGEWGTGKRRQRHTGRSSMTTCCQYLSLRAQCKKALLDLLMARDTQKGQELMNCLTQTPTQIMTLMNQRATRCLKMERRVT